MPRQARMNKITITALEPQKKYPNRRSVYGNGTFLFGLDEETCVKSGIRTGNTYSPEELEELRLEAEYADGKQYAFRLLARKSYSIAMMKKKLEGRDYAQDTIERCIDLLCEMGYVNDEDYAKSYIHDAVVLRKKGKRLVLQELSLKGISKELAERLWEEQEIPDDLLRGLIQKRLTNPSDPKCVKRTYDYCIRRGYGYSEVAQAMREFTECE